MGGKGNRNGSKLRCQRDPSCGAVGKEEMATSGGRGRRLEGWVVNGFIR